MNYLIVVAHPDDEILGAGGSIKKFVDMGHNVDVCMLSTKADARTCRPEDHELDSDMRNACNKLGVNHIYCETFPNIQLNIVPHLHLVQAIERAIVASKPDIIITHHPGDTNNDHVQTSIACQAAARLFQRRNDINPLKEFWYMEVLSSTEWNINSSIGAFCANMFVEIGLERVQEKINALECYRGVMRPYPHPRSREAIEALATYRGVQSGLEYAEAFECVFRQG